ncbi:hypothetical protein ILUMI_08932 [Ignelater luminosus]|uniref:Phospholipase B1, membrane-associated n=1 Tax=Ignelater luminosus TaxID=2038154 RepID=A0A8K0D3F7_IGNLU|nr:hypothetical protein ILUMI_08932 [Ignelater luminosus]
MKIIFITILFLIFHFKISEGQRTSLEQLLPLFRMIKDSSLAALTPTTRDSRNFRLAEDLHKLQPRLNDDVPFPCDVNDARSEKRPKSVHNLRPGDIDIIAALGDSLTAGAGLVATNILGIILEHRGMAFSIGGQDTWRQFVTLPNILKEFNPKLFGFATQDTFGHHKEVQFNAAEVGAMSRDLPYMASVLIKRLQDDSRVNIAKHWKIISIMIGSNDFCADVCYSKNPESSIEAHRKHMTKALRLLRDSLPRTLVNVLVTPNLKVLANVTLSNRPPLCYFTHNVECPCLFGLQFAHLQDRLEKIMVKWQDIEIELANSPEFDRDDFTVVVQPFTANYTLHRTARGLTDYSSLSEDCFHLSQKENARAGLSLWNNILEPVGKKSATPSELYHFKCPSKEHPFIFTRRNSIHVVS